MEAHFAENVAITDLICAKKDKKTLGG
jgi:hypothetical protein